MIAIIDYGMSNLGSIRNMLEKIGAPSEITSSAAVIERATKLILPGVGSFGRAMQNLGSLGLIPVLNRRVLDEGVPILGICLGMQLLSRRSEEGAASGLGWIEADTVRFRFDGPSDASLKIPHMGWNTIALAQPHPLFEGLAEASRFYFVHSYHVRCQNPQNVLATARYGLDFHAAVVQRNIAGTQFHPEKSHRFGLRLLRNFAEAS